MSFFPCIEAGNLFAINTAALKYEQMATSIGRNVEEQEINIPYKVLLRKTCFVA